MLHPLILQLFLITTLLHPWQHPTKVSAMHSHQDQAIYQLIHLQVFILRKILYYNYTLRSGVRVSLRSNFPISPCNAHSQIKPGTSNLAQLNTSPWPTTGSSPVQSTSQAWPPNLPSNLKSEDDNLSLQQKQIENRFDGIPSSNANSNFADFGNINTFSNTHQPKSKSTLGPFPDPFGAAPNSNLHQQSGKHLNIVVMA